MFQYIESFITDVGIDDLISEIPFSQDYIMIDGKKIPEQRLTYWMSSENYDFQYGGKIMIPSELTSNVDIIRNLIMEQYDIYFDSVLANFYPTGKSGMRYHSDPLYNIDGEQMWDDFSIVVSFGGDRRFTFRKKDDYSNKTEFIVSNGDIVIMKEGCQQLYQHRVHKAKTDEPRISLVFKKRI